MTRLYIIEQSALAPGGHYYAYTRTVAEAASTAGLDVVILENRRFRGDWKLPKATTIPAFTHTWGEADQLWITDWAPGNVAYEFVAATRRVPPQAGDHVLFHTLSYAELRAVLLYLGDLSHTDDLPFFHILLRYDPDVLENSLEVYRPLFDRIAASPILRSKILFHTDTHLLSDAFARLAGLPFTTLPIPFAQDRLVSSLATRRPKAAGEPLSIIYLGDARLEKNYGHLPTAVSELWSEFVEPGRLRFVLQSNFNTPGGETGIMSALQRLGQYSPRHVELINQPMTFEDYYDRLAEADVVVIPYDAQRYQARSSGVLIEAMAAGKPVVTSAGSWMATQVDPSHSVLHADPTKIGGAIATLMRDFDTFKTAASARAAKILDWSSGANFVRSMIETAKAQPQVAAADARHILVIMDGDAMVLRNGASKVAESQFKYLRDSGYRITGLFLTNRRDTSVEELEAWTATLKHEVAPYGLERVFVTGPGRYSSDTRNQSSLRNEYGFSIAADTARAAAFDVSGELLQHVQAAGFDAVLLNYVTNYPLVERLGLTKTRVICEVVDIQSFQKAIYGAGPVQQSDLDDEFALLAKCDHLISLNPMETTYVKDRLPHMPVTTTGIFIEPRPISVGTLAGSKSLAEVISSCAPEAIQYQFEKAWGEGVVEQILKLIEMPTLDLVYVSSNHSANVSGLRWFLEYVYGPYLAPAGVSMVVAGSIGEVGGWPEHKNLHFLGRLGDVAPLYAAARVAVLPITEGAGMPVKTAEAMSYGCPIVATTIALRGMGTKIDGVTIADEASAFAQAVLELLKSPALRLEMGAKARQSSEKLNGIPRYVALMDEAFKSALGNKAQIRKRSDEGLAKPQPVEWNEPVRLVNRLCRSYIDNEALEPHALNELKRYSPTEVKATLDGTVQALMVDRSSPLLKVNTNLLRATASPRVGEEAASFMKLVEILSAKAKGAKPVKSRGGPLEIVSLQDENLDVWAYSPLKEEITGVFDGRPLTALPSAEGSVLFHARLAGRPGRNNFSVAPVSLVNGKNATVVASQKVSFGSTKVFGEPVAVKLSQSTSLINTIMLAEQETVLLGLPRLVTSADDVAFVDLVLGRGSSAELVVSVNGESVVGRAIPDANGVAYRFRLGVPDHDQLKVTVSVTAYGASAALLEARTHIVVGDDPDGALAAIDAFEQKLSAPVSTGDLKTVLPVRELMSAAHAGEPLRREAAASLRKPITDKVSQTTPAKARRLLKDFLVESVAGEDQPVTPTAIDQELDRAFAVLWPSLALAEVQDASGTKLVGRKTSGHAFVASGGLTVDVTAEFADATVAADVICLIDGAEAASQSASGSARVWRRDGASAAVADWIHKIEFANAAGKSLTPKSVELKWYMPALQDYATARKYLALTNLHSAEMHDPGFGQVWTGPGLRTLVSVPIALVRPTDIVLDVSNFGGCLASEDVSIALNGQALEATIERSGSTGVIRATYPGEGAEGVATSELVIFNRRMFDAPGDDRRLGICLTSLAFSQKL